MSIADLLADFQTVADDGTRATKLMRVAHELRIGGVRTR